MSTKKFIQELAENKGTPFYLIETKKAEENFSKIKKSFPKNTIIAYATKANYSSSIINLFKNKNTWFDTFTLGEVELLLENKVKPEKIIYTSVSETTEEFTYVLSKGVKFFVIGSYNGFCNLKKVAQSKKIEVNVLLRVQPIKRVLAGTTTSGIKSKFGVVFEKGVDSAKNILSKFGKFLNFKGFHFHIGTQVMAPEFYIKAINRTLKFVEKQMINIEFLDIGGGYPFAYNKTIPPVEIFGKKISEVIEDWRKRLGEFKLIIEPGRALVANTTTLVTKVVNIKSLYGRKIAIVDASTDMVIVPRHGKETCVEVISTSKEKENYVIAGNLCHSRDWIIENPISLPRVSIGDLILFKNLGAYVMNHNIPYGLRKLPKIFVLVKNKIVEEKHPFELALEMSKNLSSSLYNF